MKTGMSENVIFYIQANMYRYSELQLKNKKLTRQVTEKDEQLEEMRQKVDSINLELRKSEKAKKEVSLQLL